MDGRVWMCERGKGVDMRAGRCVCTIFYLRVRGEYVFKSVISEKGNRKLSALLDILNQPPHLVTTSQLYTKFHQICYELQKKCTCVIFLIKATENQIMCKHHPTQKNSGTPK